MSTTTVSGFRFCVHVNTRHVSHSDRLLLGQFKSEAPITAPYTKGFIIFGHEETGKTLEEVLRVLEERGYTKGFLDLYKTAFSDQNTKPILMHFSKHGPILPTIPVHGL